MSKHAHIARGRKFMRGVNIAAPLALMALALLLIAGGCSGGDEAAVTADAQASTTMMTNATPVTGSTVPVGVDPFSTFKTKDPFIQQAITTSTSAATTTTKYGQSTSTTYHGGTTSTTRRTTTTTNPSQTTDRHHSLKVLSIDVVNGTPVVTIQVDTKVYEDLEEGDVVSTSWGQVKILDINANAQTVTLLHGSETRTLAVGQTFLK